MHEATKSRNSSKRNRHGQYNRIKSPPCNQALHHLQMHKQLQIIRRKQKCSWSLQRSCSCSGTHLKGKNYPHSHLDTEFLPLKFILLSLFLSNLSAEQEKYLSFAGWFPWENKVSDTGAANTLVHKNPPQNPIFWDFQLTVSSQFPRSNSRPRTELNLSWGKDSFASLFLSRILYSQKLMDSFQQD